MIPEEKDIIQACIKKDRKATELFYKKYYAYLYKVCYIYLRNEDDSKDAVSGSFMKIFNNLSVFDERNGNLIFWMRRIAINVCIDMLRRAKKIPIESADDLRDGLTIQKDSILDKLQLHDIIKYIESLGSPMKEIVKLFAIEGYSHLEIADMLNISENYSRILLSQARKLLQMEFKEEKADA